MYRKRKRSTAVDMEAITAQVRQKVTAEITEDVRAKVTKDVMTYLAEQGLLVKPPTSRSPSPAQGRRSSCASATNAAANESELGPNSIDPDSIDLLKEPTECVLVADIRGLQAVVADGRVFPKEFKVQSVPIEFDHAVVQVEYIHPGYEDYVLQIRPSDDVKTLGEALLQRIQWPRLRIFVKPSSNQPTIAQPNENTNSAKSGSKGSTAVISTKQLFGDNSNGTKHRSPSTSDGTKTVPKEPEAANPSTNPKILEKQVVGTTKPPMQHKVASQPVVESVKQSKKQKVSSKIAGESGKKATNQNGIFVVNTILFLLDLHVSWPLCNKLTNLMIQVKHQNGSLSTNLVIH
jgi:hypothetical protein